MDRRICSEGHFWSSLNYVHHNPVKHGYVSKWQDWPFSSAGEYLKTAGKEKAEMIWRKYPILDYGKDWDGN
jgi:putative transposase